MVTHNEYRDLWKDAGYSTGVGSAIAAKPPPPGRLPLYYFMAAEHGCEDIEYSRIKVSQFSEVNDPFELRAVKVHRQLVRLEVEKHVAAQSNMFGMLCFSEDWISPALWAHYANKHTRHMSWIPRQGKHCPKGRLFRRAY